MELVTVLTLNYNNPFLYESIDSVLNQTYSDIQYIIFDDCSQKVHFDVEEIKRYIETHNKGNIKKVVVKQNEKNMGIIKNLNRAMKYVKGKYIFHLAGDGELGAEDFFLAVKRDITPDTVHADFPDNRAGGEVGQHIIYEI